jgi:hypothetical protein
MITCNFCGTHFPSVEEYEKHIDTNCSVNESETQIEFIGTQTIRNGKSEFRILSVRPNLADEKKQSPRTDEEGTVPVFRFCEVSVWFGVHVKNRLVDY